MSTIDFFCDGEIATLTLNNPGKLNAINLGMWNQLAEKMAEISVDRSIRCVVLRGAGSDANSPGSYHMYMLFERSGPSFATSSALRWCSSSSGTFCSVATWRTAIE